MNRFFKWIAAAALAIGLAGCGEVVEVPAAAVGKVMSQKGYLEGVKPTSKFRLDPCVAYCDKIVLMSIADQAKAEPLTLFMPKDKLNMTFGLQATLSIRESEVDNLFNTITPMDINGQQWISTDKIYETYAQQIIRAEAREFLSQFTINDIASNLEAINGKLSQKLTKSIQDRTPFNVRYVGLSNLGYPPIVTEAQEAAAKRTEMIRQEEAQLELSKTQLERQYQEQVMQRKIDVEKARADAEVNKVLGDSLTPQYVRYQELEIMKKVAESQNKVFLPFKMLDTIGGQLQLK